MEQPSVDRPDEFGSIILAPEADASDQSLATNSNAALNRRWPTYRTVATACALLIVLAPTAGALIVILRRHWKSNESRPAAEAGLHSHALDAKQQENGPSNRLSPEMLFRQASPSVVKVEVKGRDAKSLGEGTGFFVDENTLVTNAHVLATEGAAFAVIRTANHAAYYVDEVQAIDKELDIAILNVPGTGCNALELTARDPRIGEKVFAIGNALGFANSFSDGLVSGINRRPSATKGPMIQTTAAISSGNSGGPLLDAEGRVLGVTTLCSIFAQNLNFAIPAATVQNIMNRPPSARKVVSVSKPSLASELLKGQNRDKPKWVDGMGSLEGLSKIRIVVGASVALARYSITDARLERLARLQLRKHGVAIDDDAAECLSVSVSGLRSSDTPVAVYTVSLECNQRVTIDRGANKKNALQTAGGTWGHLYYGLAGDLKAEEAIVEAVQEALDQFAIDFHAANRRKVNRPTGRGALNGS